MFDDLRITPAFFADCIPDDVPLNPGWSKGIPLAAGYDCVELPSKSEATLAGQPLWRVSDLRLAARLKLTDEQYEAFEWRLEDELSADFVDFKTISACFDPRIQWKADTLLAQGPDKLPFFVNGDGITVWRVHNVVRFHASLYAAKEPDRQFEFEGALRAIAAERRATTVI